MFEIGDKVVVKYDGCGLSLKSLRKFGIELDRTVLTVSGVNFSRVNFKELVVAHGIFSKGFKILDNYIDKIITTDTMLPRNNDSTKIEIKVIYV